jgi:hypothetical protein
MKIRNGNYLVQFVVSKPVLLEPYDGSVLLGGSMSNGFLPSGASGAQPLPPTLGAATKRNDGTFAFRFSGVTGTRYQVLTSTDLVQWEVWKEFVAESDTFEIVDDVSPVTPRRFFRVVAP